MSTIHNWKNITKLTANFCGTFPNIHCEAPWRRWANRKLCWHPLPQWDRSCSYRFIQTNFWPITLDHPLYPPLSPNDPACPEGLGECVDNVSRSIWYNHVTTMATDSLFLWLSLSVHLSACARESVCVTATISQLHNIERLSITRYNNIFLHAFYNLFDHSWFIAQISLNVSEYGLPYLQSICYYPE